MAYHAQIIYIQPLAPVKPMAGAACNGCGVCCLVEPCPLGMFLSGKRKGACDALRWNEDQKMYRCGAISSPRQLAVQGLPASLQWMAAAFGWLLGLLARRWTAAGMGCDSNLLPEPASKARLSPSSCESIGAEGAFSLPPQP